MLFQKSLALFALSYADAFSPSAFSTSTSTSTRHFTNQQSAVAPAPTIATDTPIRAFTRLYAGESEETEAEAEVPEEAAAEEEPAEAEGEAETAAAASAADDILNSPAFLNRKIDVLKSDIAAVEEKIEAANALYEENKAEWGPQIETLRKEYANISSRLDDQSKAGSTVAAKEITQSLINVLDNYDRAFKAVEPSTDTERETEAAYKEVYSMIVASMAELGVTEVETVGQEFNYEFHQAVMMRPDEDYEEGIVCEELQKGWVMEDGFLIRAAMVVVTA